MKESTIADRIEMFQRDEFEKTQQQWTQGLELQISEDEKIDNKQLTAFRNKNLTEFQKLAAFLQITGDWFIETAEEVKV